MIRRPPRSTLDRSSAASDVYKRQILSRMGETELAVRIDALAKRYGTFVALDGVSIAIARGEAFGLVGANGAGKTTLIRCLLDLVARDAGAIEIFGVAAHDPGARRRLAYLP